MGKKSGIGFGTGGTGRGGNIITPDQLSPEQIFMGLIQDVQKMQVLMNEMIVRYNGLVNLLIEKQIVTESDLQTKINEELEKLKESMKKMLEEESKIITPDVSTTEEKREEN